jgi:hypothetical protein
MTLSFHIQLLTLKHFNWALFVHPPYSPDLALSDCYLFTYLKNWLISQFFNNNEMMEGAKTCLSSQMADIVDTCNKCLSSRGDYVQKLLMYIIIFSSLLVLLTAHWELLSELLSYMIGIGYTHKQKDC